MISVLPRCRPGSLLGFPRDIQSRMNGALYQQRIPSLVQAEPPHRQPQLEMP